MEDEHDRAAARAVEVDEQVEHLDLVGEVEVGGRLVEQQQVGALGQRHGDPHALALAAGQLVDRPVGQVERAGGAIASVDDRLVVGGPLPEPLLVRVAAAGDQVGDGDALGRDRRLRQDAEPGGDLPGGQAVDRSPSSSTVPALAASAAGRGPAAASTCRRRWRRRCT